MQGNTYDMYNSDKSAVMTASAPELTRMLYDAILKSCNIAEVSLRKKNTAKGHESICKAQDIIRYLRETLDMRYSTANDFENIYLTVLEYLSKADATKNPAFVHEAGLHIRMLRDAWIVVMKKNGVAIRNSYLRRK
jgi:flagellar protein FliS